MTADADRSQLCVDTTKRGMETATEDVDGAGGWQRQDVQPLWKPEQETCARRVLRADAFVLQVRLPRTRPKGLQKGVVVVLVGRSRPRRS